MGEFMNEEEDEFRNDSTMFNNLTEKLPQRGI